MTQNLFADDWDIEQSQPGYTWKRMRVARRLGGELLGASVYELPPGQGTWPYHLLHLSATTTLTTSLRRRRADRATPGTR